ncbi:MAG: biotin--[acetyl-CoA-carboxylase] ligase [Alphaproteobacteria bacterium]|nr:MAG: biotin--[acetyl-CoA-carboxylase] ligase [Alphaproteobacteria bacterium]
MSIKIIEHTECILLDMDEVESTQILARNIINGKEGSLSTFVFDTFDAGKFVAIKANRQTGGIGQYGRVWHSPSGDLSLTCIIPLQECIVVNLTQVFTILVYDMLSALGIKTKIKWINDLLYHDGATYKKLGGILCEILENDGQKFLLVGFGMNIVSNPIETSVCLNDILKIQKDPISLDSMYLANRICQNILYYLDNFQKHGISFYIDKLNKNAAYLGEQVEIRDNSDLKLYEGKFVGYSNSGFLLIENTDGNIIEICKGRMVTTQESN